MIVKIEDVGFNNKGAALMLLAVLDKLKEVYGKDLIIVVDELVGSPIEKAKWNLYQEAFFQRFKIKNIIPTSQLLKYSLVNPKDINLILNASGFSLGDQWLPIDKTLANDRIRKYKFYKSYGAKIVYLPQAYGPFLEFQMRNYVNALEKYVDIFFVRDNISMKSLKEILKKKELALLYPDFTNIYEVPEQTNFTNNTVLIIPNFKMFYETDLSESKYIKFLSTVAEKIHDKGLYMALLNHEGQLDREIIDKIVLELDFEIKIYDNHSPDEIKSIIKSAYAVITSRFHGAVSALSQGVPVLVTSWSHKYQELLKDYSLGDNLLDCTSSIEKIQSDLLKILDPSENHKMRKLISKKASEQKEKSVEMWNVIFQKM